MRLLHLTDTHMGITKERAIRKMLARAALESFDVILHTGDYSGGVVGSRTTIATAKLIQQHMPGIPFVTVIGNHDRWVKGRRGYPTLPEWTANYERIRQFFQESGVHFLDEDGPFQHPSFPNTILFGHSGWYNTPYPPTNDFRYLPLALEGNTNRHLLAIANKGVFDQMDQITEMGLVDPVIGFVSHFPVINVGDDYKGSFNDFSWSSALGENLVEWGVKAFYNGHAHQLHEGPLRYEPGSDYQAPSYRIWELK